MEDKFIDVLMSNSVTAAIAIFIGGVLVIFAVYQAFTSIKKLYDSHIEKKTMKEHEEEEFRKKVTDSIDNIKEINTAVVELKEDLSALNSDFTTFRNDTTFTLSELGRKQKEYREELGTLLESDKEAIKAYIISEYQKWTRLKYIDIYAMQCLEARYEKYLKENGDTFIATLMKRLRTLPSKYMINNEYGDGEPDDHSDAL